MDGICVACFFDRSIGGAGPSIAHQVCFVSYGRTTCCVYVGDQVVEARFDRALH